MYTGHIDGTVPIYVMVYVLHSPNTLNIFYLLSKSGGKKGEKRLFLAKVSQPAPPMGVGCLILVETCSVWLLYYYICRSYLEK